MPAIGWGFASSLNFCLGLLEVDGLRVNPFDRHPDGNHRLRDAGLTAEQWRAWLHDTAYVDERVGMARAEEMELRHTGNMTQRQRLQNFLLAHPPTPVDIWSGSENLRHLLEELWDPFGVVSNQQGQEGWDAWVKTFDTLWDARAMTREPLRRIHERLGPGYDMEIYFVDYPGPVVYASAPRTLLMAVRGWTPTAEELADRLIEGVDLLADTLR